MPSPQYDGAVRVVRRKLTWLARTPRAGGSHGVFHPVFRLGPDCPWALPLKIPEEGVEGG